MTAQALERMGVLLPYSGTISEKTAAIPSTPVFEARSLLRMAHPLYDLFQFPGESGIFVVLFEIDLLAEVGGVQARAAAR